MCLLVIYFFVFKNCFSHSNQFYNVSFYIWINDSPETIIRVKTSMIPTFADTKILFWKYRCIVDVLIFEIYNMLKLNCLLFFLQLRNFSSREKFVIFFIIFYFFKNIFSSFKPYVLISVFILNYDIHVLNYLGENVFKYRLI